MSIPISLFLHDDCFLLCVFLPGDSLHKQTHICEFLLDGCCGSFACDYALYLYSPSIEFYHIHAICLDLRFSICSIVVFRTHDNGTAIYFWLPYSVEKIPMSQDTNCDIQYST